MDIEIYREFMALAAHKSFVSAARDLNMSQPSLSRHMTSLSNNLGCKLFYETRPLSLTAAGEVVLRYASKIVGDEENMIADLRSLPSSGGSRIRIIDMLHTNVLYVGLNEVIAQTKEAYPDLRVDYPNMDASGFDAQQMVQQDKVDVAFETILSDDPLATPCVPDDLRAIWIPEFHGELVMGISQSSPLATRPSLKLEDLASSRFILQANRYSERFRKDFVAMCAEVGFYPNISLVPVENPLMFYGTEPADGIHLLSRVNKKYKPLIANLLKQYVVIRPLCDKKRYVDSFALVKRDTDKPALAHLADLLEQHAEALHDEVLASD
ncbi:MULTISPECIES: LysR family transcriptional regulator [unclassified Adlercreutzia]|uniref:LysR family transcriptional regulator n=1 Tax=unclassified Adlercreutzia TaxID=2636013 RepID=UPI0013ED335D|nr:MULTISPECIES: LysR family transcriptional regulator [unclassified Adlercreutzia]